MLYLLASSRPNSIYAKIALTDSSLFPDNIPSAADSFLASDSADKFDFNTSLVLLSAIKQEI
jgi:hypothetical protein